MKYENVAKVGQRIRSYDFESRKDCYIEGTIQSVENSRFVVLVDTDCFPHKQKQAKTRVGHVVYVPMETLFAEYDGRIILL